MSVFPVAPYVDAIDNGLLGIERYGATYVVRGKEGTALVEVGTSLSVPRLLAGLRDLGVDPGEVTHVLCTHVHMDHAGAAGHLVEHLPRANVVIHSRSHRHLVDPTRLLAGVEAAVGPLFPLYGDIRPLDPQRLLPAEDLHLDLGGGVHLEAVPTPGHARDHLVYLAPHAGALFAGDAAGVSLFEHRHLRPVTAPPHFDLEGMLRSLETMRALRPACLCFSHFGRRDDPEVVFYQLEEILLRWDRLMRSGELERAQSIVLEEQLVPPDAPHQELWRHFAEMNLRGFLQYYGVEP